jgi:hypothetical protein
MRMLARIGRLFKITNGFEAGVIIYALALGAALRGEAYLKAYPGGSRCSWLGRRSSMGFARQIRSWLPSGGSCA